MSELPQAPEAYETPPPRPAPPRARARSESRPLRRGVVAFALLVVLFWGGLAVLIGTGRLSLGAEEDAPFGVDARPLAAAALAPRDLLPPPQGGDRQTLGPVTADEATATYAGERRETRVTVRRYADEAAARAAVRAAGQAVREPKQQRERVGVRARDFYQYDGGNPGRSGLIYSSGVFVMSLEANRTEPRETYARACPY